MAIGYNSSGLDHYFVVMVYLSICVDTDYLDVRTYQAVVSFAGEFDWTM